MSDKSKPEQIENLRKENKEILLELEKVKKERNRIFVLIVIFALLSLAQITLALLGIGGE